MQPVVSRRGDTLVEVLFAIVVFAMVSIITVNLMNGGIYTAQKSLEITMTRNEIDAQAEALRFIQNSYLAEREHSGGTKQFRELWVALTEQHAITPYEAPWWDDWVANSSNINSCEEAYDGDANSTVPSLTGLGAFVLNTRLIQPQVAGGAYETGGSYADLLDEMVVGAVADSDSRLVPASLYPRIIYSRWGTPSEYNPDEASGGYLKEREMYRQISEAEGIWIITVKSEAVNEDTNQPEFFDFHIRTCWNSVGRTAPSTIDTIVRLYNPEVIEGEEL